LVLAARDEDRILALGIKGIRDELARDVDHLVGEVDQHHAAHGFRVRAHELDERFVGDAQRFVRALTSGARATSSKECSSKRGTMASRNASFPLFSTTVISCSTGVVARHGHFGARKFAESNHIGPRDQVARGLRIEAEGFARRCRQ